MIKKIGYCILVIFTFLFITGCDDNQISQTIDINQVVFNFNDGASYTYTGSKIEPKVHSTIVLINQQYELEEGRDYTLSYSDNINIGTAKVIIHGMNTFSGEQVLTFYITSKGIPIQNATVTGVEASYIYNGYPISPVPVVNVGGTILSPSQDYRFKYINNNVVGQASIQIDGINNYIGTKIITFEIKPDEKENTSGNNTSSENKNGQENTSRSDKNDSGGTTISNDIAFANVEPLPNKDETGSVIIPNPGPKVTYMGKVLTENVDYTISYSNNKGPGAAVANIKGKGSYNGTKKALAFYIISKRCGKSSQKMEVSAKIDGLTEKDKLSIEEKRDGKGRLVVEAKKGETINLKVTLSPLCGAFLDVINASSSGENGYKNYISHKTDQAKKTSLGSIEYIWRITPIKSRYDPVLISQYHTYKMDGYRSGINYSALIAVKIVNEKSYEKVGKDPVCGKVDNGSTTWRTGPQTICVNCSTCVSSRYCETYDGKSAVTTSSITITGTNGVEKKCPINVYVSNNSLPSKPPICEKVNNGSTTWRKGPQTICVGCSGCPRSSYCKTYTGTPEVSVDTIPITGDNGQTVHCKVNAYVTSNSSRIAQPKCGNVVNGSTTFRIGPQKICVYCTNCASNPTCQTFSTDSKLTTSSIKIYSTDGKTSVNCPVNVYIYGKSSVVDTQKCCCATNYGKDCKMQNSCDSYRKYTYNATSPTDCNSR